MTNNAETARRATEVLGDLDDHVRQLEHTLLSMATLSADNTALQGILTEALNANSAVAQLKWELTQIK